MSGEDDWFSDCAPAYNEEEEEEQHEEEQEEEPVLDDEDYVIEMLRYPTQGTNLLLAELKLAPMPRMSGSLKELNMKAVGIYEQSRELINLIYHSDIYLQDSSHMSNVFDLKYNSFNHLRGLHHKLQSVVEGIFRLGGPLITPPRDLWAFMYFFWFDESARACAGTVPTPKPQYEPPSFITKFPAQDIDMSTLMNALKMDEIGPDPRLDNSQDFNLALMQRSKELKLKTEECWAKYSDALHTNLNVLIEELIEMGEEITGTVERHQKSGHKCYRPPYLLINAITWFRKKKRVP